MNPNFFTNFQLFDLTTPLTHYEHGFPWKIRNNWNLWRPYKGDNAEGIYKRMKAARENLIINLESFLSFMKRYNRVV
jgi:hypothetical protein